MSAHQPIGQPEWVWDGCAWVRPGPCSGPPPCPPPCPPFPPRPIQGPIAGVTTGAAARPGEVGEFLLGSTVVNFAVNTGTQTILAQPLVLTPGDWDVEAYMEPDISFDSCAFFLSPQPPGFSDNMTGYLGVFTPAPELQALIVSERVQGLVNVPTLLPFTIVISNVTTAGTATLTATARRMR